MAKKRTSKAAKGGTKTPAPDRAALDDLARRLVDAWVADPDTLWPPGTREQAVALGDKDRDRFQKALDRAARRCDADEEALTRVHVRAIVADAEIRMTDPPGKEGRGAARMKAFMESATEAPGEPSAGPSIEAQTAVVLGSLSERERKVLEERFGVNGPKKKS